MEQKVVKRTLINANINKNNKLQLLTFWMPYGNIRRFYGTTTFAWTIGSITINSTLSKLLTFKCTMVINNFLCMIAIDYNLFTIAIDNFCIDYCN